MPNDKQKNLKNLDWLVMRNPVLFAKKTIHTTALGRLNLPIAAARIIIKIRNLAKETGKNT